MAIIKLVDLISCSSQAEGYGAENLMYYHLKKAWLSSSSDTLRQIEAEFQLFKACHIDFIDIGNRGSSTFEVQVARSSNPTNYVTLLPAVTMLTLVDLKGNVDKGAVYMFKKGNMVQEVAEQKWDRVKIICRQPYCKKFQFGLKFLILRTKNDWEIQSNDENQDLFEEEKSYYSLPVRNQCTKKSDVASRVISRGEKLVQASKVQHFLASKALQNEDHFKEDVRIFLIACSDEVFTGLSLEGCIAEFERQRQEKLCPEEKMLYQNVYHEFKVSPSIADKDKNTSFVPINMGNILSKEDSFIDISVLKNRSHIVNKSNIKVSNCDTVKMPNIPFISEASLKLHTEASKKRSSHKFNYKNTAKAVVIFEKDYSQLQNVNSSTAENVSKFPVHTSVSSLKSQKNLSDISKTVKRYPEYRRKETTSGGSVARVTEQSNAHSSIKRHQENSTDVGSASNKKFKTYERFPIGTKEGFFRPEDFIQFDGSQPSTSKGFTLVDCPICLESFHPVAIEKHAATCGEYDDTDCKLLTDADCEALTDTCPFCAAKFSSTDVNLHIENCFRYH